MPTFQTLSRFEAGWKNLTREQQARFREIVLEVLTQKQATPDRSRRSVVRVREVAGHPGIFELRWSSDGRAMFCFGAERVPGQQHVIWRQIGTFARQTSPPEP